MFLIVNNMLNKQQNNDMLNLCQRARLPHKVVSVENGKDFYIDGVDISQSLVEYKKTWLLSLGSYNLALYLKNNHFDFGHNLENLSFRHQFENWGKEVFLNGDGVFINIKDVERFDGKMFFRPIIDSKTFNAGTYDHHEIKNMKSDEPLLMAKERKINAEYRFVIIKGKVADNSSYKVLGKVNINQKAPSEFVEFLEGLLKIWLPTENFVIDIAEIEGKPKIIEVNNIHCSRFYGCSIFKIIESVI